MEKTIVQERDCNENPMKQQPSDQAEQVTEMIHWVYDSYNRAKPYTVKGFDRDVRHPEWTRHILDVLGNPDAGQYNVAVTGSKGKGSHAIILAALLQQLGLRVGLFTSPHLVDFLERFRVDGQMISESAFLAAATRVKAITDELVLPNGQYLGPVGLIAVIACLWFQAEQTDVNIIELGRGALHDDVNQIQHSGAVLTPVFLEHKAELGPTLADVCREKAGVITDETRWLVSYVQGPEMEQVLNDSDEHVYIHYLQQDFTYRVVVRDAAASACGPSYIEVDIRGEATRIIVSDGILPFAGNIAVAWAAACRVWVDLRPNEAIATTVDLSALRLPGRLDVIETTPIRMIDGTVHRTNAKLVAEWLRHQRKLATGQRFGAIIGIPSAKDGQGVVDELCGDLAWLIVAKAHNPHLEFTDSLAEYARQHVSNVFTVEDIEHALELAEQMDLAKDNICVLGTQSFIGDALRVFGAHTQSIWRTGDFVSLRN